MDAAVADCSVESVVCAVTSGDFWGGVAVVGVVKYLWFRCMQFRWWCRWWIMGGAVSVLSVMDYWWIVGGLSLVDVGGVGRSCRWWSAVVDCRR